MQVNDRWIVEKAIDEALQIAVPALCSQKLGNDEMITELHKAIMFSLEDVILFKSDQLFKNQPEILTLNQGNN